MTVDQYKVLQRFWWAVGQFNELLAETPDAPDDVLDCILESVGPVFEDLDMQEMRIKHAAEGGAP